MILLDTGDALTGGGILGDATQGEAVVAGMNLLGYSAMALGPKELALGGESLRKRMEEARFAVLSANVMEGSKRFAEPYAVLTVGERRIAVVGLTRLPETVGTDLTVSDPEQALSEILPQAAAEAETIILLTNLDYRTALALASAVPGIDLVIAALPAQLPQQVVAAGGTGSYVVTAEQPMAKHTGRRVGRLRAVVQSDGSLTDVSWQSLPMTPDIVDDAEMATLLDGYR